MSTFLFSVLLETSAKVDPDNMHGHVVARLRSSTFPPLSLVEKLDVQAVPVSDKLTGIEAATLVELVNAKRRILELEAALK